MEGVEEGSDVTPFLGVGVERELLAWGGEPVLFSIAEDFGKEFSRSKRGTQMVSSNQVRPNILLETEQS